MEELDILNFEILLGAWLPNPKDARKTWSSYSLVPRVLSYPSSRPGTKRERETGRTENLGTRLGAVTQKVNYYY